MRALSEILGPVLSRPVIRGRDEVESVKDRVPEDCAVRVRRLHFHEEGLDACMGGVLVAGQLIQFSGPAGSGKTQTLLHLVAEHLLDSDDHSVFYIQTQGHFPAERMAQLLASRARRRPACGTRSDRDRVLGCLDSTLR